MRPRPAKHLLGALLLLGALTACADRTAAEPAGSTGAAQERGPASLVSAAVEASLATADAPEIVAAARAGLRKLLDAIPADRAGSYGFAGRAELERAALGAPYQVWTSDADEGAVTATDEWRFPVIVDGSPRALLTVARVDGEYRAVDLGATALSRELGGLERDRGVAAGARRVLLRLPAARADLAAFPAASARVEDSSFEPLASARAAEAGPTSAARAGDLLPWARQRREASHPRR